jgi:hypothetical protein
MLRFGGLKSRIFLSAGRGLRKGTPKVKDEVEANLYIYTAHGVILCDDFCRDVACHVSTCISISQF